MKQDWAILSQTPLFTGIPKEAMETVITDFSAVEKTYRKAEVVLLPGEIPTRFGIVLSGSVQISRVGFEGNTVLLAQLLPGEIFAEAFAFGGLPATVTAETAGAAAILWLKADGVASCAKRGDDPAAKVIINLTRLLARKNIFLTGRIEHLSRRTLREKVLSFLSEQAALAGSREFTMSLNRQEMADYLASDRSALSAVLCRMRDEGIIAFHKNRFALL